MTPDQAFASFISQADFASIGAKAALAQGGLKTVFAQDIRSAGDDHAIHDALMMQAGVTYTIEGALASPSWSNGD
jgi:hypothetical protein